VPRLRKFQRRDVDFIKKHKLRVLIASSMGTGKTCEAITALLETARWSLPALVVCPASVTRNWRREFRMWAEGLRVQVLQGHKDIIDRDAHVQVISWALIDPRCAELRARKYQTVIADECHLAKNPDALRSQALYKLTRKPKGLLLLTGTPITNSKDEMAVLQALYGDKTPPMIRHLLEDVAPDVPPKTRKPLYIQLRDRARAEYDRADSDFETWLRKEKEKLLGDGMAEDAVERALSAEAFAKIGYLRRLVGQFKVPAAADWVARAVRIGEPVVVFVEHQAALKRLSKALKKQRVRHVVIEGKTTPKKRQKYIDLFQQRKTPVIICTKAGKEGITLHAARHMLFVERFFTSTDEEQSEDRCRRIGQKHPTTIWYLHALDTIDDRLDGIIRAKRRLIRSALRSEDTHETGQANAMHMVRSWDHFVAPKRKVVSLGLGDPLPPLPSPSVTHAVVFYKGRWNSKAGGRWCKMNGYVPGRQVDLVKRFKLIVHPAEVFKPKEFSIFRVCKDIRIIVGERLSQKNEREVRKRLQGMGRLRG